MFLRRPLVLRGLLAAEGYDGDEAVGVYSTRALADAAMLAWNATPGNPHAWGIRELELDKMPDAAEAKA